MAWSLQSEPIIRLTAYFAVFVVMALWEANVPFRPLATPKPKRWLHNLSLAACSTLIVRVCLPAGLVGVALLATERGLGVFNLVAIPNGLAVIVSVVLLDFAIYLQHVMFHAIPALWRLHLVHHTDRDFDVTTGTRFHPIEIILSMAIKVAVVVLLGAPAVGVLVFEILLNATAMFNHGNVRLPPRLDGLLRWFIVTPDMHRVHHSVHPKELNSNFGFSLTWWDRLLGTYIPEPAAGQEGMTIGVAKVTEVKQTLGWMLALPFRQTPK